MAQYKTGDKVVVRKDLVKGKTYHMNPEIGGFGAYVTEEMLNLAGETVTIREYNAYSKTYSINESIWSWTDEMFEGLEKDVRKANNPQEVVETEEVVKSQIHVEKVIYNNPATILFYRTPKWSEHGQVKELSNVKKVVSKCMPTDVFDKERGYLVCVLKAFKKEVDRMLKKY